MQLLLAKKINERRGYVILKAFGIVKELQGPETFQEFNHDH
jgi:hypothetical protein